MRVEKSKGGSLLFIIFSTLLIYQQFNPHEVRKITGIKPFKTLSLIFRNINVKVWKIINAIAILPLVPTIGELTLSAALQTIKP